MRSAFPVLVLSLLLVLFFSSCNNCPDYLLTADVRRYNPYQLNQTLIFENASQAQDTFDVTRYEDRIDLVPCDNSNNDFQVGVLYVTLTSRHTDSLVFRMGANNNNFAYIGFGEDCCEPDIAWDATTDTLHFANDAPRFGFAQTETVNGTTYSKVATFTPISYPHVKSLAAKVSIDHGLIAYQDLGGVWWYLQ